MTPTSSNPTTQPPPDPTRPPGAQPPPYRPPLAVSSTSEKWGATRASPAFPGCISRHKRHMLSLVLPYQKVRNIPFFIPQNCDASLQRESLHIFCAHQLA